MKRHAMKKVAITELKVDRSVNFRDDYDLPSLREEVVQAGQILEPIHAIQGTNIVLKGNRRTLVGQQLHADPSCPSDLKKKLEGVDVIFYSDLTEQEITELVLDHGSQKPLSRAETVKAVWRLQRQMYTERDVITLMYNQLARYSGNTRKAYEAQQISAGEAREKFLQTWLHGTVGNYLLAAGRMGQRVQEQLLLSETALDRGLTEEEQKKVQFQVNRGRITALTTAMKKDKEGAGWSPETGGAEFNAAIEKFVAEDKSPAPRGKNRFTAEQMEQTGDAMQSGLRLAFHQCAGKLPEGERSKLEAIDTEYYRRDKVFAALTTDVERIKDENVQQLVKSILSGTVDEVNAALASFVK